MEINGSMSFPLPPRTRPHTPRSRPHRLYLNGAQVGINSAMTLTPASLGTLANLYLGKSKFSGDPYLNGALDDFRIYGYAMDAAELAPHADMLAAPQDLTAEPGPLSLYLSWSAVASASR